MSSYLPDSSLRIDQPVTARPKGPIVNVMSVDVEDYFQVSAFEAHVERQSWGTFESRVCRNTDRLLELFDAAGVTATFFMLGWVADRFPELARRVSAAGHEIASHGYAHRLVYEMSPTEFTEDLRQAKVALENAAGQRVTGYRAPSYTITRRSLWAFDVLVAEGYLYDASVYPIHHDRYGIPDSPRHTYRVTTDAGSIWELPGSTMRRGRFNFPIGGGGYFRLMPYRWTRYAIGHVNRQEGRPVIFYLHPWEIDPAQPRINASAVSRFRHYQNLAKTEPRLKRLLSDFKFGTASSVFVQTAAAEAAPLPQPIAASA